MKYTLTITDMDEEEFNDICNYLAPGDSLQIYGTTPQVSSDAPDTNPEPCVALPEMSDKAVPIEFIIDSEGMPWDERIHASTKTKKKDGTWKARKGVDKETIKAVETELTQNPDIPLENVVVAAPPVVTPAPTVTPVTPTVTPPPVAQTKDFAGFMTKINELCVAGHADAPYLETIKDRTATAYAVELNAITDISADERLVAFAWQCLEVDGKV